MIYNNGTNKLLDASEYSINVAHGDEVFVGTVPVVTYEDEDQKLSVMLNITVSKVKLGIEFENTDKIIQQEQAQYITPKITNAVENHAPSIITRYYSQAIGAYTDGITQSGVYVISVTLIGNDYEFEGENTITVYVQTGILKSNDGKVVVIDPQGFENGVRVTVREYTSTSQLDGIIDLRTFNVKKCYEIQLWKDGEEYFSSHMLTIRFNLGRDVLESNKISVLQIPSDTDIYYECEYETVDRDNIELSSKVLGAFVFGEKVEFVSSSWWIALVVGLVILASVTVSVMILITKRRKRRKIANGINVKLGRR